MITLIDTATDDAEKTNRKLQTFTGDKCVSSDGLINF